MKKTLAIIAGIVLVVGLFAGCGANNNPMSQETPDQGNNNNIVENIQQATEETVDKSQFIGEEEAKKKALERAGISAEGVVFDRVELDRDDGVWIYELDFKHNGTEYDVDIKADTGEVLEFEKEKED